MEASPYRLRSLRSRAAAAGGAGGREKAATEAASPSDISVAAKACCSTTAAAAFEQAVQQEGAGSCCMHRSKCRSEAVPATTTTAEASASATTTTEASVPMHSAGGVVDGRPPRKRRKQQPAEDCAAAVKEPWQQCCVSQVGPPDSRKAVKTGASCVVVGEEPENMASAASFPAIRGVSAEEDAAGWLTRRKAEAHPRQAVPRCSFEASSATRHALRHLPAAANAATETTPSRLSTESSNESGGLRQAPPAGETCTGELPAAAAAAVAAAASPLEVYSGAQRRRMHLTKDSVVERSRVIILYRRLLRRMARSGGCCSVAHPTLLLLLLEDMGGSPRAVAAAALGSGGGSKRRGRLGEVGRLLLLQHEWQRAKTVAAWRRLQAAAGREGASTGNCLSSSASGSGCCWNVAYQGGLRGASRLLIGVDTSIAVVARNNSAAMFTCSVLVKYEEAIQPQQQVKLQRVKGGAAAASSRAGDEESVGPTERLPSWVQLLLGTFKLSSSASGGDQLCNTPAEAHEDAKQQTSQQQEASRGQNMPLLHDATVHAVFLQSLTDEAPAVRRAAVSRLLLPTAAALQQQQESELLTAAALQELLTRAFDCAAEVRAALYRRLAT
ncbi:hypothetical protein cyc_04914 [Cyclospora cayetanensis]|uniref:Uncharacterized protein n=1 Tax=Cyclospora cayetanensis TaxID=88456 RepID=A0A1D3D4D9_9EIME|nr:hypothetical protein cyc_04914 [Cyclospora cayetanensis]